MTAPTPATPVTQGNPGNLVQRAAAHQSLTPWERTALKLGEGLVIAGLVSAIPVLIAGLQHGPVQWAAVATAFAVAFLVAFLKLLTSWNEPPLPGQMPAA